MLSFWPACRQTWLCPESDSGVATLPRMTNSKFKDRVLQIVWQIPKGRVTTYGMIAALAGVPRGARLVGGILHYTSTKESEEEIPWQRIINRHGFISTKCLEHPKQLQKTLLEQEGVEVSKDFVVDLSEYGWWGNKER